jgi:limonene-1,2-epoxide hydrolase
VDEQTQALLAEHVALFNAAVRTGDFAPLVELFADDAELAFENVPVGPFRGRDAIAAAYAAQPPDDELDVLEITEEADGTLVERFAWRRGGTGKMRIAIRDGEIAHLVVEFE